ncbi:Semaphorin-7A CDw108 JMH blood group antigen [Triplophysa tibetana]|uniref:Semaphorin-7A CDw108 JMH blood group antigen n=1 Tax=Triplophysa tibetana TaxID=1572043 RepID=A0A5A9NZP8_9TELE|nr:Semaphorin-7A CDw108 JMH blood group antigen [Triplophysa tibetana]
MILTCVYVLFMWIICVHSTRRHDARVIDTDRGVIHYSIGNRSDSDFIKLVKSFTNGSVLVADQENLYSINTSKQETAPQIKDQCAGNAKCEYTISLLRNGLDENLLLVCRSKEEETKCYNLNSSHSFSFQFDYGINIHEPSLLVGDMLYFTKSNSGLYRINQKDTSDRIWPHPAATETYVKLMASKDTTKVFSFFTEKQRSVGGDYGSGLWIPRVSQICTNDRGGSKDVLQFSWTSKINARLYCGGVEGEQPFSNIVDVDTVTTHNDVKIYVLFRNFWNMSAVCVYNMSQINSVFSSSEFMEMKNIKAPADHRPGQCDGDSTRLKADVLRFMKEGPEVKDRIMPETAPLIFLHHHYTHIKVDTIKKTTVLYLALESGGVHKVLGDQPVFIITEFRPFRNRTRITSMLLDTTEKRLYVSSAKEVIHIDLQMCHVYGEDNDECVLSRDPYCCWNGYQCAPVSRNTVQCLRIGVAQSKPETDGGVTMSIVPPSSRYYLDCPTISCHASYHWYRGNTRLECVRSHNACLYLIESMNETHEGSYRCESTEGGYHGIITRYELRMNASPTLTVNTALLPCLLLLLTHLLS